MAQPWPDARALEHWIGLDGIIWSAHMYLAPVREAFLKSLHVDGTSADTLVLEGRQEGVSGGDYSLVFYLSRLDSCCVLASCMSHVVGTNQGIYGYAW